MRRILRNLHTYIFNKLCHFYGAFLFACIITTSVTFIFTPVLSAHQVTLAWDPNTESDLAGYIAYWGTSSGIYPYLTDVGNNTSHTISGLEEDQVYYFAITAYDSEYNESDYSEELAYAVPATGISSSSDGGGGGGCFVATAVFDSTMVKYVVVLLQFKDKILLSRPLGRAAVLFYDKFSPLLADSIATHNNVRRFVRWSLLPLVGRCRVALKLNLWTVLTAFMALLSFIVLIPLCSKEGQKYDLNFA